MLTWLKQAMKDAIGPTHPGHLIRWYHVMPKVRSGCRGTVRVLDGGCGNGIAVMHLAARYPHAHFVGADIQDMCYNQSRAATCGLTNVSFEQCDLSCECPRGPFDIIFSVDVMEHVEDPQRMLQLLSSELQPDGQLIFHVPCRSRRNVLKATRLVDERIGELMEHRCDGFTQSDLHTMVRNADLKIVSMRNTFARWVGGLAWEISTLAQRCAWCDNELGALLKPYVMATALAEAYLGIGRCWPGRGILLVAERAVE